MKRKWMAHGMALALMLSLRIQTGVVFASNPHGDLPVVTDLALGYAHTCAIAGNAVYCWGDNARGQLGLGTTADRPVPGEVLGLSGVDHVAAGEDYTCATVAAGGAYCWGYPLIGVPGDLSNTPVPISGVNESVRDLDAYDGQGCVVTVPGAVKCWLGSPVASDMTLAAGISTTVQSVAVGINFRCVLSTTGGVYCWGSNSFGQLGDGTSIGFRSTAVAVVGLSSGVVGLEALGNDVCALTSGGQVLCWGERWSSRVPVAIGGLPGDVTQITMGNLNVCAQASGDIYCLGVNDEGQNGNAWGGSSVQPPERVVGLPPSQSVVAGGYHTCALTQLGGVMCWGNDGAGQLGDDPVSFVTRPQPIPNVDGIVMAVATGHTCALRITGEVLCWGYNLHGAAGRNPANVIGRPNWIQGLGGPVKDLAAGTYYTCALLQGGTGQCWGRNDRSQLGHMSSDDTHDPVDVIGLNQAIDIAAGQDHTCAARAGLPGQCWGDNFNGQLGFLPKPTVGFRADESPIPDDLQRFPHTLEQIAVGKWHSCGLTSEHAVFCWGDNSHGEAGIGVTEPDRTLENLAKWQFARPTVGLAGNVQRIAAGISATCALLADGTVRCWGQNLRGILGNGSLDNRNTPTPVVGLAAVQEIAMSSATACVLLREGRIKCWGDNRAGQLGDGSTTDRLTPVDVQGLPQAAVGITVGSDHACAILADRTLWCWGSNSVGQLGTGRSPRFNHEPRWVIGFEQEPPAEALPPWGPNALFLPTIRR